MANLQVKNSLLTNEGFLINSSHLENHKNKHRAHAKVIIVSKTLRYRLASRLIHQ